MLCYKNEPFLTYYIKSYYVLGLPKVHLQGNCKIRLKCCIENNKLKMFRLSKKFNRAEIVFVETRFILFNSKAFFYFKAIFPIFMDQCTKIFK